MGFVRGDRPRHPLLVHGNQGREDPRSPDCLRNGLPPFVGRCGSLPWDEARYTVPSTEKGRALPMPEPTKEELMAMSSGSGCSTPRGTAGLP